MLETISGLQSQNTNTTSRGIGVTTPARNSELLTLR